MTRLLLVGAGHSHLLLLEKLPELRAAGLEPVLIAPRWFDYSGLVTGMLSGALPLDASQIDVAALAWRRGVDFIDGEAEVVESAARQVRLADGRVLEYDLLSLCTGSGVADGIGAGDEVWPVKPLANLRRLRLELEQRLQTRSPTIVVAGGSVTGTEVAASLAGLVERHGRTPAITLVGPPQHGRAWADLGLSLERRGIRRLPERRVVAHTAEGAQLDHGGEIAAEFVAVATGLRPARAIAVGPTLQSLDDPAVFATGDCALFAPRPLPHHGVFGVRQAPVLAHNIAALARGAPLVGYRPQRRYLSILDLGNGEGFATWGGLANRSRAALRLKRRLDFGFVRRFQP